MSDILDDIFGPVEEFAEFSKGKGTGERVTLPANTKVLARLVKAVGKEFQPGRFSVDAEFRIIAAPSGHPSGAHLWDNFRLTYPPTAAAMKGQPDDMVAKWKAAVGIWTRRVQAFGLTRAAAYPLPLDGQALTELWGGVVGTDVIIRVGLDEAGRTYTDKSGVEQTTKSAKNTVQDYEPADADRLTRYGLEAPPF